MSTKRIPRTRTRTSHEADDDLGYLGTLYVDGERVYAVGGSYHHPTLLVSDDGGRDWRRLSHPNTPGLRSILKVGNALYLTGEYGALGVSVDSGLTWTPIDVGTQTCLFDLQRAADGSWWIAGDDGEILKSTDGITYQDVGEDDGARWLSVQIVDGVPHVLGYNGTIRRWDGTTLQTVTVDEDTPLTDLVVTKAGTWVITADGGQIYRSLDRGKTWTSVDDVPSDDDLEAIIETPQGLLAIGDEAAMLFSDDDGQTWVRVPNELEGHLWSIEPFAGSYLIGGDEGAIWSLEISATETVEVPLRPDDDDDDDDDDGEDDDDDDDDDEAVVPARFDSIEQASARWIREGTVFAAALNGYVRKVYAVGPNKAGHEPSETRKDMADYVREQLVTLNAAGEHRRARALFPPAYEPFDYDGLGQSIPALAYLRDGRRLARVGVEVFELQRDKVVKVPDVWWFAQSADRRWVAKGIEDRIEIHDGWDGPRVRTMTLTCEVDGATVAPDGDAVLAWGDDGIHWITERGAKRLLPDEESDSVSYPHAALSPNGRFVAMGTQDSSHIVVDRKTGRRHTFDPMSSYPHFAAFHHDRPEVILSSCHALYGSGSQIVDLDAMVAGKTDVTQPFDQRAWVYCVGSTSFGYLLGDRSGYIWAFDHDGEQQWYAFLGSTMTALDMSPDRTKLIAGSFAGIVVELDLTAKAPDPRLLTDGPVTDVARWVFWQGHPPLLW
ncbi:MAG: hypothetical protein H0V17_13100 [Deltaproteobacteria bacterium]|nr:hypothetical protein [Deltaproteobacteria bacterium]